MEMENMGPKINTQDHIITIGIGKGDEEVTLNKREGTWQIGTGEPRKIFYGGKDISSLGDHELMEKVVEIVARTLDKVGKDLDPRSLSTLKITNKNIEYDKTSIKMDAKNKTDQQIIKLFASIAKGFPKTDKSDKTDDDDERGDFNKQIIVQKRVTSQNQLPQNQQVSPNKSSTIQNKPQLTNSQEIDEDSINLNEDSEEDQIEIEEEKNENSSEEEISKKKFTTTWEEFI